jgi:cytoskeleton protein RodZ
MAEIGATLREARMRAKIDITEVETRTKIRAKYLRAIENEEWDLLPGEIYVKSFLRTYGDYLGLDSRLLVDEYKRRYERTSEQELHPLSPRPPRERERQRGPVIPPWALIGLVLVGVLAALYFVGNSTKTKTGTTPTAHRGAGHRPRHRRQRPAGAAVNTTTSATSVRLQLIPTGSVYVCLVDSNGHKLIPGQIFSAGQTIPIQTAPRLLLTLGNASVKLKLNGAAVPVPPSSAAIGFLLKPSGATPLPAAQQPRCA